MNKWVYRTNNDNTGRDILGEQWQNPLFCFGVNPSTAEPSNLDPTLRIVKNWSNRLGYDGWVMVNIYPQRATNPNDLHGMPVNWLHRQNKRLIYGYLGSGHISQRTIWAAWGTLIEKRTYLRDCLRGIIEDSVINHNWITIGKKSKDGHPHHPLYLPRKSQPEKFDIEEYLDSMI